jgi:signal transduction histidine kinase
VHTESLAAIGEAITGLAHESRNALQRTQACVELLGDCVSHDPEAQALVSDIQHAQDELNYLYEKVRNYATPRPLHLHSCCLGTLVQEVWRKLEPEHASRQVTFQYSGDARGMVVQADPFAIKQLFRNLFENVLAACSDPVVLRVELRGGAWQGSPAIEVRVQDNGPGVPAELAEQIFEPFFTTKIRGTGLGLAICKRIVDDHGGDIRLERSTRAGATFVLTLPRCLN